MLKEFIKCFQSKEIGFFGANLKPLLDREHDPLFDGLGGWCGNDEMWSTAMKKASKQKVIAPFCKVEADVTVLKKKHGAFPKGYLQIWVELCQNCSFKDHGRNQF